MNTFAFLGTGPCDPNKELLELLAVAGAIAGWSAIIYLIVKIYKSSKSTAIKVALVAALVTVGVTGSFVLFLAVWIGLACGRY